MRLTILGGGGFRVPLIHRALLAAGDVELTLHDGAGARLAAIGRVLADQARGRDAPGVTTTTDLTAALDGADFIFSAIRVGGLEGRITDERVALAEGVLGQETAGAGGISYALRTVPVAAEIARRVAAVAPDAWVINFTNPAGLVTEAMAAHLGDRVIGICDSPVGLGRRVAGALAVDAGRLRLDYAGLNHLGWLLRADLDGRDLLPGLLADPAALATVEEGRLFGAEWLQVLGALPNEYLHYYYNNRESVAELRAAGVTRGEMLLEQQRRCYDRLGAGPADALSVWDAARLERERTYRDERDEADLVSGGYEHVALALMRAIGRDERTRLILNVRNRGAIPVLDDEAVVEVPCTVDAAGARPDRVAALPDHAAGLVATVKASERAVLEAVGSRSAAAALRAFAVHPLVDSVTVAGRLLAAYRDAFPELTYLR
jgi:6-phospho-beta-glucosidase